MALRTSRMLVLLITLALSATVIDLHGGSGQACAQAPGDDPDALVAGSRASAPALHRPRAANAAKRPSRT